MKLFHKEKKQNLICYPSYKLLLGTNKTISITEWRSKTISVHITQRDQVLLDRVTSHLRVQKIERQKNILSVYNVTLHAGSDSRKKKIKTALTAQYEIRRGKNKDKKPCKKAFRKSL